MTAWHVERCGSSWGPRRVWARPTRCSKKPTGSASAARTSSSRSPWTTAAARRGRSWRDSKSSRPGGCPTGAPSLRRWTWTPSWPGHPGPRLWTNTPIPTSRAAATPKRWQDVDELLNAGINVLSTVNIQHLASLGDVVSAITDVRQAETVPDDVVRRADQIDLVDIPPELLRQRLSDGKIYAADKIDAALLTISGWATSVRCASSPCCGWPTGWTKGSRSTGPNTASRAAGPPGSASSWA